MNNKNTKIYIASDHAGFKLKNILIDFLTERGYQIFDEGAFEYNESDDYPDFISKVAQKVSENPTKNKGIILGGSGQGEAIVANRFKDIRAIVYYGGDENIITLSREHNDANIISLGARFVSEEYAKKIVELWLNTDFSQKDRHIRRNKKIDLI